MQSITTLTNNVSKLQDELRTVLQHVHWPGTSAAAGSKAQLIQSVAKHQGRDRAKKLGHDAAGERIHSLTTRATYTPGMSHSSSVTKTRFGYAIETVSPKLRKAINLAQLLIPTNDAVNTAEKEHSCDKENKYNKDLCLHKLCQLLNSYMTSAYTKILCAKHIPTAGRS